MNIRLYTSADEARCLGIFESNCPDYFSEGERKPFLEWLRKPGRAPYYVLEDGGETVACGGVFSDPEQKLAGLAWGMVLRNLHRQGYGSHLTQYRLQKLDELFPGYTYEINTAQFTTAFYARFGYRTVKIVENGWGEGLDKYVMRKK